MLEHPRIPQYHKGENLLGADNQQGRLGNKNPQRLHAEPLIEG